MVIVMLSVAISKHSVLAGDNSFMFLSYTEG